MKKLLITLLFGFMTTSLWAQDQLRIEYILESEFDIPNLPPGAEVSAPKQYYELIVDKEESLWSQIDRVDNEQKSNEVSVMVLLDPLGDLYKNTMEGTLVEEVNVLNKNYLLAKELDEIEWEITRESKDILGFKVQKATGKLKDKSKNKSSFVAWYAPSLNFKNGPARYWGLPGLILEIEISTPTTSGGESVQTLIALKVEHLKSKVKLKVPSKGKSVTEEELRTLRKESYEKMKEMYEDGVDLD